MNELMRQLVDLYAGDELDQEARTALEQEALGDAELAREMFTLKTAVEHLRSLEQPQMGEESFQRVLMRLYKSGAQPQSSARTRLLAVPTADAGLIQQRNQCSDEGHRQPKRSPRSAPACRERQPYAVFPARSHVHSHHCHQ